MQTFQHDFVQTALACQALKFGEFTLKSGRLSPYFFNMGALQSGKALAMLGKAYAKTIQSQPWSFDVLFGPAYKGIPLAAVTTAALYEGFNTDKGYCFNRKETKDHGEGGVLVGHPLKDKRVLVIDDVMTKGTAINEAMQIIDQAGGICAGVVIALDRQEVGEEGFSAVASVEARYDVPVKAIITLQDILQFTAETPDFKQYQQAITTYQQRYGATAMVV